MGNRARERRYNVGSVVGDTVAWSQSNKKAQPERNASRLGSGWRKEIGGLMQVTVAAWQTVQEPKTNGSANNAIGRGLIQLFRQSGYAGTLHADGSAKGCAVSVKNRFCFCLGHHG